MLLLSHVFSWTSFAQDPNCFRDIIKVSKTNSTTLCLCEASVYVLRQQLPLHCSREPVYIYSMCQCDYILVCTLHCVSASACAIQAAVGDHPVQEVYLSSTTKKLLVRLADSCDRLQNSHKTTTNFSRHNLVYFLNPYVLHVYRLQVSANQSESRPWRSSKQWEEWKSERTNHHHER